MDDRQGKVTAHVILCGMIIHSSIQLSMLLFYTPYFFFFFFSHLVHTLLFSSSRPSSPCLSYPSDQKAVCFPVYVSLGALRPPC